MFEKYTEKGLLSSAETKNTRRRLNAAPTEDEEPLIMKPILQISASLFLILFWAIFAFADLNGTTLGTGSSQPGACADSQNQASFQAQRHREIETRGKPAKVRVEIGGCQCSQVVSGMWHCTSMWSLHIERK